MEGNHSPLLFSPLLSSPLLSSPPLYSPPSLNFQTGHKGTRVDKQARVEGGGEGKGPVDAQAIHLDDPPVDPAISFLYVCFILVCPYFWGWFSSVFLTSLFKTIFSLISILRKFWSI